uniref:Uncharacterized protein n=1 Tax=Glossina pallidipes TaxID=7398 RepID=A0A1B0AAN0_GLOPL
MPLKETNAIKSFIKKVDNERTPALLTYINETRGILSKANQSSKYKEIELKSHESLKVTKESYTHQKYNGLNIVYEMRNPSIDIPNLADFFLNKALNSDINFNDILTGYYKYGQSPTDVLDCL